MTFLVFIQFLGVLSAVFFVGTLIAVPWMINCMDERYFLNLKNGKQGRSKGSIGKKVATGIIRNTTGLIILLLGVAMLVLPGQGILTILLGLCLMDFRGKRKMILYLVAQQRIQEALNWIRRKGRKPDFLF